MELLSNNIVLLAITFGVYYIACHRCPWCATLSASRTDTQAVVAHIDVTTRGMLGRTGQRRLDCLDDGSIA